MTVTYVSKMKVSRKKKNQ